VVEKNTKKKEKDYTKQHTVNKEGNTLKDTEKQLRE